MKEDLWKLLISEREMYQVNGLGDVLELLNDYRHSLTRTIDAVMKSLTMLIGACVGAVGFCALIFMLRANMPTFWYLIPVAGFALGGIMMFAQWVDWPARFIASKHGSAALKRYQNYQKPDAMQTRLFGEVERYNKLVRSVHVADEFDAAGVAGAKLQDRAAVLKSLSIAREDLVRALKIERIMRENADVANTEFQLFNVDFTHLTAMQVEDAATQQGQLMNEAFKIAQSVQTEVRKIQRSDNAATA